MNAANFVNRLDGFIVAESRCHRIELNNHFASTKARKAKMRLNRLLDAHVRTRNVMWDKGIRISEGIR